MLPNLRRCLGPPRRPWLARRGACDLRVAAGEERSDRAVQAVNVDSPKANTIETHLRSPTPIVVFPEGDSASGVTNMIGNVNEWTSSAWDWDSSAPDCAYPYDPSDGREEPSMPNEVRRVLRGGSWADSRAAATAHLRLPGRPDGWDYGDGIRLACASRQ